MFTRRYGSYSTPFTRAAIAGDQNTEERFVSDAIRTLTRTPVGTAQAPVGQIVDAQRLHPFNAQHYPNDSPEVTRRIPHASFDPGMYGDMQVIPIVLEANVDVLALARPVNSRVILIIQNTQAANILFATFDNAATTLNGIQIPAGGNLFFDSPTPQNDLHLLSTAAGTIILSYMNVDIVNAHA